MSKKMLIDATHPEETRVVVVDGNRVEEFDYESVTKLQISGNIYLARVTRVEPSLQAAFVDYGGGRHGFLAFAEVHPDYYQIPKADREALVAAESAAARAEAEAEEDDDRRGRRGRRRRGDDGEDAPRGKRRNGRDSREGKRADRDGDGPKPHRKSLKPAPFDAEAPGFEALTSDGGDALVWTAQRPLTPAPEDVAAALAKHAAPVAETPGADEAAEVVSSLDDEPSANAANDAAPKQATEEDLAGVVEIEIRRPASAAERAATGQETVSETVDLTALGAQEHAAEDADVDDAAAHDDETSIANAAASTEETDAEAEADDERAAEDAEAEADAERDSEIEEIGADDAREEVRPRRIRMRDYNIQEVIKRRQIMLVQVVKEERGTKGAALTTYLSLAGRYCVLMPNTARGGGISRKITNAADRKRLKAVVDELEVPEGMGLIVRTAGANRTKAEIKRDYEYLLRQWEAVRELTLRSIAPCMIYEEGSLVKRAIRDLYGRDVDQVFVEGEDAYREAKDYMKMLMPSHARNVQPYRDATPLFIKHQVESQMAAMLTPKVQLKSGGYLIIGVTEALVAIDVNSGKSTKEANIEETALKTNLEAADEIPRQLKLRDLAGLIVIDFIDMEEGRNNRAVEKRVKDKLKGDRARIQVGRISGFGLLEMSRQRLRPGLLEATTIPCPHCRGLGVVRSDESMSLAILRAVEEEGVRGRSAAVRVAAPVPVANYLINHKRERVALIEERYGLQVIVDSDPMLVSPDYTLERTKPLRRETIAPQRAAVGVDSGYVDLDDHDDAEILDDDAQIAAERVDDASDRTDDDDAQAGGKSRRKRRRRGRRDDENGAMEADADANGDDESIADAGGENGSDGADEEQQGRSRGRRGGRRRKRNGSDPLPVIDLEASDEASADDGVADDPIRHSSGGQAVDDQADDGAATEIETVSATMDAASEGVEATAEAADAASIDAPGRDGSPDVDDADSSATDVDLEPEVEAEPELEAADAVTPPRQVERDPNAPRRTGWWALRRGA